MKSLRKKILASALAVTLVGGVFAPKASAAQAEEEKKDPTIWEELNITKTLQKVQKGVTTPNVDFQFKFEPITKGAPNIDKVTTISFTADNNEDADIAEPGVQVERTESVDLSGIQWNQAGTYEYILYEVIPDNPMKDMDYGYYLYNDKYIKQRIAKDLAKDLDKTHSYRVVFQVIKKGDEFKVENIVVKTYYGGKRYTKIEYDAKKGVKFKNYYDKKDGNTPGGGTDITEADKKGFAFKKIVDSNDDADKDKEFEFNVQVDKPAESHLKETTFKYVVVDKDGKVGGEQEVAYSQIIPVKLKHNERVVFTDVILGSKVSVTEKNSLGLTPSVKSEFFEKDGVASNDKTAVGIIGDTKENYAEFTNKNETIPPITGVLIDNLPYIALVAVAGLGIFFFVKNRREEEIYA